MSSNTYRRASICESHRFTLIPSYSNSNHANPIRGFASFGRISNSEEMSNTVDVINDAHSW